MNTRKLCYGLAALLLLCLYLPGANAEDQTISPEKRELIHQLLDSTHAYQSMSGVMDSMFNAMEKGCRDGVARSVEASNKTPAEKAALVQRGIDRCRQLMARMKELSKGIDIKAAMQPALDALYAKYYSEDDLKAMLAWWQSPTGQKLMSVQPQFLQESMQMGQQVLGPQFAAIADKAVKEMQAQEQAKAATTGNTKKAKP